MIEIKCVISLLLQSCVSTIRSQLHKLFYILAVKRLWWLLIKETEHRTVHIIHHHLENILITEGIIIINTLLHTCFRLFYVQCTKMSETITPNTFHRQTAKLLQIELPLKKNHRFVLFVQVFLTQIENIRKTQINQLKPNDHETYADSKHL